MILVYHDLSKTWSCSLDKIDFILSSFVYALQLVAQPFIIGLTGGIACGKSSVCRRLEELGAGVVDCDKLGKADLFCFGFDVAFKHLRSYRDSACM